MENASKALIIAGAILLAIIIISLGIMVVNNARNQVNQGDLTEADIQTFNSKFSPYIGKTISGSQMQTLFTTVQTNNLSENRTQSGRYVCLIVSGDSTTNNGTYGKATEGEYAAITKTPTFSNAYTYKITGENSTKTGLIWKITAEKQ